MRPTSPRSDCGSVSSMSSDDEGMRQTLSFTLEPDKVRKVHDDAVEAFDAALAKVGTGEVNHFIDPRRLQTFEGGGPPVWSVATVPTKDGTLYLTYGMSEAIDPARIGVRFEMSVMVPGEPTMWPALLLRALCRYMLGSRRPLEVGQSMPFPDPITRFFAPPEEAEHYPNTAMNAAFFAEDPALPRIETEHGNVQVRRAVGLYDDERALLDLWTPEGFSGALVERNRGLVTDIGRAPYSEDPAFVSTIEAGSLEDGSRVGFVAVPGVQWGHDEDHHLFVSFPGGEHAKRILQMIRARLPFERNLLVHDLDPEQRRAVAFEPSKGLSFRKEGETLVMEISPDHELFDTFEQVGDGPGVNWRFGG